MAGKKKNEKKKRERERERGREKKDGQTANKEVKRKGMKKRNNKRSVRFF